MRLPENGTLHMTSLAQAFRFFIAPLCAALLGHAVIDFGARWHIFGSRYADYEHVGVSPVLLIAVLTFGLVCIFAILDRSRGFRASRSDWFVALARSVAARATPAQWLAASIVQFSLLATIEATEQLLTIGHLDGALTWLGAPLLLALVVHIASGITAASALRVLFRGVVDAAEEVLYFCAALLLAARGIGSGTVSLAYCGEVIPIHDVTISRRLGKRGPPAPAR